MTVAKVTHTAGPWAVLVQDNEVRVVEARNPTGPIIADVGPEGYPMIDADARLIAAAPELLEALTGLLAVYDEHLGGLGTAEARTARLLLQRVRLAPITDNVRALLARVQGEG